jgi:predicted RND superfamily exporter protein
MVASVIVGISVDATVHLLWRFQRELPLADGDYEKALSESFHFVGRPILMTAFILFFGFIVLCASNFYPTYQWGFLTALSVAAALISNIVLLPALLLIIKPIRVKK